ncbi:MAG: GntR family transcriptional regulator [Halanaerobiales bacterium]|nr:GntR family transcriptional regulator [Halanaerobiales bacterium]
MKSKEITPRYLKIALDIAYRIFSGEFKEKQKISGRSTLAGTYNVSPETIRRSVSLLKDMNVVEVIEKSGIHVISKKNAQLFIQKFNTQKNIIELKEKNLNLIAQKKEIEREIEKNINSIIEYSIQLRNFGMIHPFEIEIKPSSPLINKTVGETHFWQNTGATIIGVKRDGELCISPGCSLCFAEKDVIFLVCKSDNFEKIKKFIETGEI